MTAAGMAAGMAAGTVDPALAAFASVVGGAPDDRVCVAGGRTQWDVGGPAAAGVRVVTAPAGVVSHQPDEMIVRVRAGTTVGELDAALAAAGQMVPLDPRQPQQATVGGVLAVGHSGNRRLRYGPVRDTVLEVRFVTAEGKLVKAGGPVVKNVTGFDLCRLLIGSLGTLGFMAEVVLRCYPVPAARQWLVADEGADPFLLHRLLFRPSAILWDGQSVWVLLEGHPADVAAQASTVLRADFRETSGPPPLPPARLSLAPAHLSRLGGLGRGWLAEVGVGTVHTGYPSELAGAAGLAATGAAGALDPRTAGAVDARTAQLQAAVKARFDPTGRLNPGRRVG